MVTSILTKNTWIHLVSKAADKSKMGNEPDTKKKKKKPESLGALVKNRLLVIYTKYLEMRVHH